MGVKENTGTLAVKQADVRLDFRKNGTLRRISLPTNKVIEMKKNGLLLPEKVEEYSMIELVHEKKLIPIPVVKGSGKYYGPKGCLLRFLVEPTAQLMKREIHNWHLQSTGRVHEKGA